MPNPSAAGIPNPASYDTSHSGVVIDELTGLMWQRELAPLDAKYTFEEAVAYCGRFEAAGHCDFRLPSRIELVSLVDFGRPDPAIDSEVFPSTQGDFMSASPGIGENSRWSVRSDGATFSSAYTNVASTVRVRCVRQHVARQKPEPRYVFEGQAPNETVTDQGTGLVWQRRPAEGLYTFAAAEAYCAGLGTGVRVPSMKELQTIVDETTNEPPLIDEDVFLGFPELRMGNAFFWTSSGSATYPGTNAWSVNFGNGAVTDYVITIGNVVDNEYYVRCVR
jgi:hypothetical protein